jgi:Ni/Co efflux regulator RcnB
MPSALAWFPIQTGIPPRRIHENDSRGSRTTPPGHGSRHAALAQDHRDNHAYKQHQEWKTGSRIQQDDWNRGDNVDYRQNHLRRPPSGHEWRQIDGNYVLANHDGVIVSIRQSHHDRSGCHNILGQEIPGHRQVGLGFSSPIGKRPAARTPSSPCEDEIAKN